MTDTQYKKITLPRLWKRGAAKLVMSPMELKRGPFGQALASQDSIFNGNRLLLCQHTGGSAEWLVDNTGTGGLSQVYPEPDVWRTAMRGRCELGPGQALELRVLSVPGGPSEVFYPSIPAWLFQGAVADIRAVIDYENLDADTDSVTVQKQLLPSLEDDGLEDVTAGAAWKQLQHHYVGPVRPADITPAGIAKWSEWPTVTFAIEHRGGARVLAASVHETPFEHVTVDEATTTSTLHDYSNTQNGPHPTLWPVTKDADGATYDEPRFGTFRGLHAAARQSQRMGPVIAQWSSYAERLAEPADTEADPVAVTSTTFVGLAVGSAETAWHADNPGYDMPPYSNRAPENLRTRLRGNAASIPVRARVYARFTTTGANFGYVKFQSSPRSWMTVTVPQHASTTTYAWHTMTGHLETNVTATDGYAILQDFARVSTGGITMEIRYWSMEFCDYPVAA
jgi:hypothetical protein